MLNRLRGNIPDVPQKTEECQVLDSDLVITGVAHQGVDQQKALKQIEARNMKHNVDRPLIFSGCTVYFDGRTDIYCSDLAESLSAYTLGKLFRLYGGGVTPHLSKTGVSHVICCNLTKSKTDQHQSETAKYQQTHVKPDWIIDSIKAHMRLSEAPYNPFEAPAGTQGLNKFFKPKSASASASASRPDASRASKFVDHDGKVTDRSGKRSTRVVGKRPSPIRKKDESSASPPRRVPAISKDTFERTSRTRTASGRASGSGRSEIAPAAAPERVVGEEDRRKSSVVLKPSPRALAELAAGSSSSQHEGASASSVTLRPARCAAISQHQFLTERRQSTVKLTPAVRNSLTYSAPPTPPTTTTCVPGKSKLAISKWIDGNVKKKPRMEDVDVIELDSDSD